MKKILFTLIILFLFIPFISAKNKLKVYLFYSSTCPHCSALKEYLNEVDNIDLKMYEVGTYSKLAQKVRDALGIKESGVPLLVIGSDYIIGYSEDYNDQINDMIYSYSNSSHCDLVDKVIENKDVKSCIKTNKGIYYKDSKKTITVFGKKINFDIKTVSLPFISLLIGFVDGFNPCAMWVLIFLISMLLGMQNKKKMWILGITFLVSSALVYLIFMLGLLRVANSTGNVFKYVVALVALIGGSINLNSFRKSLKKDVGCQVTSKDSRKKTINKIKKIMEEKNFLIAILGIIALAFSVNLVELACSAGLPSLFIEILSVNNLSTFKYVLYIAIYILMFMIDDIIIFIIAMTTLKVTGISNKYTKYSHLVGGVIMLIIGLLMIFKMDWLMFNF